MNRELLKVFEKYRLGDKSMLCLWRNGYLSSTMRERSIRSTIPKKIADDLGLEVGVYTPIIQKCLAAKVLDFVFFILPIVYDNCSYRRP